MLPKPQDPPPFPAQLTGYFTVTSTISLKFLHPIGTIAAWAAAMCWTPMPKTTIHKNYQPFLAKNEIWPSWQLLVAQLSSNASFAENFNKL